MTKNIRTLFERAGEVETFEELFQRFYGKLFTDDLGGEVLSAMCAQAVSDVARFVADIFGCDKLFTGNDGGCCAKMFGKPMLEVAAMPKWGRGENGGLFTRGL